MDLVEQNSQTVAKSSSGAYLRICGLMAAVAIIALGCAWIDPVVVMALTGLFLVVVVPLCLVPYGRRGEIAAYVVSLYPLMLPLCLLATWLMAWLTLGHPPRSSLDDPKYISPLVDVPYLMSCLSMLVWPISISGWLFFVTFPAKRDATGPHSCLRQSPGYLSWDC